MSDDLSNLGNGLEVRRKRAAWRAQHRGTKEMDWLLGKFAEARLPTMSGDDLDTFERLLSLPDPDLNQWIIEPATLSDRSIAPLIGEIRAFHKLDVAS